MEDNKKRPLNEEELEQVTGGNCFSAGDKVWQCPYCKKAFATEAEAKMHAANCSEKNSNPNLSEDNLKLLKPIIL